jgi:adenine-specific DNA-methyltransferase
MPTLTWIGKSAVVEHHKRVPFRLLKCKDELSIGDPDSGNLLVQGDNLEALKALLPYYAGQVKCIYIDPPYNTGNEGWVYNDAVNSPEMRDWLGKVVGGEAEDLSRHDKWLCMMYPRLQLLKQFLQQDGVILVSIDDFEAYHLRSMMDEIFGRQNFIAQLVWEKGRKNDAKFFSTGHEYMLVYAYSVDFLRKVKTVWREPKPGAQEIWTKYLELRATNGDDNRKIETSLQIWYKSLPEKHPSKALSRYKHIDKYGPWRDRDISWPGGGGPTYEVLHPVTQKPCKVPESGWRFATPEAMQQQIALGLIDFREDHTHPPFRKAHLVPIPEELDENIVEDDEGDENNGNIGLQVMPSVIYKQSQVAVKYLRQLMGGKVFENPKDHEVIARLIRYITEPGDIILDSFAGSGTTGHAVLQQNADDGGKRRFILVELDANIAKNITAERLRRVVQGYTYRDPKGGEKIVAGIGSGYRFCELGTTLFDPTGQIRPEVKYADLAQHVYFIETGSPLPRAGKKNYPLLGIYDGVAIYLLYNGVLQDKSPQGGNVLTYKVLAGLPSHNGSKVIYGNGCRISEPRLRELEIVFRQIPYEVKAS